MFFSARQLLKVQGARITLEDLPLDEVVRAAGVSRSAVYRIWPLKADFVTDLLKEVADVNWLGHDAFDMETLIVAASVVLRRWDELSTEKGRRDVLVEVVRLGVARNYQALLDSEEWWLYLALEVTVRGPDDGGDANDEALAALLNRAARGFVESMAVFYEQLSGPLGLRLRIPGTTYRHLAIAGAAVVEGLAVQRLVWNASRGIPDTKLSPTNDPATGEDQWSLRGLVEDPIAHPEAGPDGIDLVSLAFLSVLDSLAEPDPRWQSNGVPRAEFEARVERWGKELQEMGRKLQETMSDPRDALDGFSGSRS